MDLVTLIKKPPADEDHERTKKYLCLRDFLRFYEGRMMHDAHVADSFWLDVNPFEEV